MQWGGALGAGGRLPAQITSKGMVLTIIRIRVHNSAMIICVCKAVSDRHIRSAVKNGAASVRDLTRELGLGTCCGKCLPEARRTLADSLRLRHDDQGSRQEACPYFANPVAASL